MGSTPPSTGSAFLPNTNTTTPHVSLPKRSCTSCRERKIKCDRQQSCGNCTKAGFRHRCVYPSGRGRAPKRRCQEVDSHVVDRLSRLESMIRQLTEHTEHRDSSTTPDEQNHTDEESASGTFVAATPQSDSIENQFGRLVFDQNRSYYVSNVLWATLGDEIEELRDMLVEPTSEDEDDDFPSGLGVGSLPDSNAALLGFSGFPRSLQYLHPPLAHAVGLLRVFTDNVAPLVRIFHLPTLTSLYWDARASLDSLDRNTEALVFAIYYSAVISIENDDKCMAVLGISRKVALDKYRHATEQALARANLLNTQSLVLLQGVILFLSALRNEDDSRTTWSLTALTYHLAQAMGLHRDGTSFGLKPFETEMRRRLWYHICLLDSRSYEYHGYEPIVREHDFDTRMPLHVNDSDLTPDMAAPPAEREEACDMTFHLIRCEVMRLRWKVEYVPQWVNNKRVPGRTMSLDQRQEELDKLKARLQQRYLRHCENTKMPFSRLIKTVARLILARTWLTINLPPGQGLVSVNDGMRHQLFLTSIAVLELSAQLLTDRDMAPWMWHFQTHIQWHALAFVLSEICLRPPGAECDRGWEHVCTIYDAWSNKGAGRNGNGNRNRNRNGVLMRPIKRLVAKARYTREMQDVDSNHGLNNGGRRRGDTLPSVHGQTNSNSPSSVFSSHLPNDRTVTPISVTTASWDLDTRDVEDIISTELMDPFAMLFPNDIQPTLFVGGAPGVDGELRLDVADDMFL